jgi:hypothetical protein
MSPALFARITPQVVGSYIDRTSTQPRWKETFSSAISPRGYRPGGAVTRVGILVRIPAFAHRPPLTIHQAAREDVAISIVEGLKKYRESGLRLDTHIARGYVLGIINHSAPELLRARAKDGSVFKASDTWVRRLLREKLNFVPRKATRAAQKIPSNAEELMTRSFMRNVHHLEFLPIEHPELAVDIDQTQVSLTSSCSPCTSG